MAHHAICNTCGKPLSAYGDVVGTLRGVDCCTCTGGPDLISTGAAYLNYFGMGLGMAADLIKAIGHVERTVNGEKVKD